MVKRWLKRKFGIFLALSVVGATILAPAEMAAGLDELDTPISY